ncbi:MAG: hypothetical protein A2W00_07530 [Candidatus Eisenbacteria bacterium RBG_16_71_46]|nr:MAG: hypothetical protein A2W00_07530 [Candidatus Eisenbacteria bacterium RBG_16_71_46]
MSRTAVFRAKIHSIGINRCVDVPARVSAALGGGGHIPVHGRVETAPLRSTLVPRGEGRHRLFVHSRIWRLLGVDRGDVIGIRLSRDPRAAEVEVPADIAGALRRDRAAHRRFAAWPPASRRQFVRWIGEAKRPETRRRRLAEAVGALARRAERMLDRRGRPSPGAIVKRTTGRTLRRRPPSRAARARRRAV